MSYLFPAAFMLQTFAMTALMIGLALGGKPHMAADVGITQAASLALFLAFSGNARSLILNLPSRFPFRAILAMRLLLILPLAGASFYLSQLGQVEPSLAAALILRRCVEWLNELHLAERERDDDRNYAVKFILLQSGLLVLALGWTLSEAPLTLLGIVAWALLPLLYFWRLLFRAGKSPLVYQKGWQQMLPHFGSSAIIGITVYVFRLFIVLTVDKAVAGDLFTAFAIGGFLSTVFVYALGPSIILHEARTGVTRLPVFFKNASWAALIVGLLLSFGSFLNLAPFSLFKTPFFWGAMGLSMVGSTAMTYAQRIRFKLLQHGEDSNVFGPDVLINILIIASVPLLYWAFGLSSFMALYLVSSILTLGFYLSFKAEGLLSFRSTWPLSENAIKSSIAFMLAFPLFFLASGGVFRDPSMFYDSGGFLSRLPIPASVLACYGGIFLLGRYRHASVSLGFIFFTFLLMVMSSIISTGGWTEQEQAKIILLLQFTLPMFAFVLGQVFEPEKNHAALLEKSFMYVVVAVVPAQLFASWLKSQVSLTPYLYAFSIYQHLQYVPVIIACCYLLALYTLWHTKPYRRLLLVLAPFMGIYAAASLSMLTLFTLAAGTAGFALWQWKQFFDKKSLAVCIMVLAGYGTYLSFGKDVFTSVFTSQVEWQVEPQIAPNLTERLYYLRYYGKEIVSSSEVFLFGHAQRPERALFPSAHNYYLDLSYNFGTIALLPLLAALIYTLVVIYRNRREILGSSSLLGLTAVTIFLLIVDNSLKVSLRQPYPGIVTFFLWGVLLARIGSLRTADKRRPPGTRNKS